jgi:hypothetical protein
MAGLVLAGCATGPGLFGESTAPAFRDPAMTVQSAAGALVAGRSTREEAAARLGPAQVVRFDSGYEVWAYRGRASGQGDAPELVLLFDPAGVLSKHRVRAPGPVRR